MPHFEAMWFGLSTGACRYTWLSLCTNTIPMPCIAQSSQASKSRESSTFNQADSIQGQKPERVKRSNLSMHAKHMPFNEQACHVCKFNKGTAWNGCDQIVLQVPLPWQVLVFPHFSKSESSVESYQFPLKVGLEQDGTATKLCRWQMGKHAGHALKKGIIVPRALVYKPKLYL